MYCTVLTRKLEGKTKANYARYANIGAKWITSSLENRKEDKQYARYRNILGDK
jgi:hypothetical protein